MQEVLLMGKKDRKTFNEQNTSAWKEWMKANNQWISFYEWYYPALNQIESSLVKQFRNEAKQKRKEPDLYVEEKLEQNPIVIPSPLQLPAFSPKIHRMLEKPNLPRHLIAFRNKGENLIKEVCV